MIQELRIGYGLISPELLKAKIKEQQLEYMNLLLTKETNGLQKNNLSDH